MASSGGLTVPRMRLAAELKRLRGNRTGAEVARGLRWSNSKISRAESGRDSLPPSEIKKLIDYYKVKEPVRERLLGLATDAALHGWWEEYSEALRPEYIDFIGLEAGATSCRTWHIDLVPGLLQTDSYSFQLDGAYRNVDPASSPVAHERFLKVRQIRQERLKHQPALQFSCILDEAVLLRGVGDDAVMRDQLAHLAAMSELSNVELRILPLKQNNALGGVPSFTIVSFDSPDGGEHNLGDVVNTESLRVGLNVEGDEETHLFGLLFEKMVESSLSATESRNLIVTTSRSIWS